MKGWVVTILFYDFEVFKYNWLVVCLDTDKRQETVIVDDGNALENFHQEHIRDIWVGFNNRHYDQYILKGILCGFDPKKVNDYIIVRGDPGWQFSSEFRRIPLINYDVMLTNDRGLKAFEGFMGDNIKESSVPFDVDRPLTKEEIEETIKYCRYDVHKTMEIFMLRQEEFNASRELIKIFGLPITSFSKTKAQIVAEICGGMRKKFDDNEFEFPIVPCLKLDKYKYILDWYKNPENFDYEKSLETVVTGVPHTFSWGGVHGAKSKNYEEGILLIVDVTAYYPSIQLEYKYGYRNMAKPENFELIHNQNLKYKNEGNKQARLPFKIADNSISGQLKDKNSSLFDPQMNNAVCVNGQLMLLMLIEMLEPHIKKLIQSNTDGLLIELNTIDDYDVVDDIVFEWERLTGMKMEFELFNKVFQKDVNNYILIGDDGKIKRKGSYVKKLSSIDYDLPIINRALVDYMVHGTPVEETINGCDDLKEFQLVTKISNKYTHILHGAERIKEKCIRVFASVIKSDAGVQKVHAKTGKAAKMANSPLHCFIYNEEVNGIKCPVRLDKQWYIDLANKRLGDFGVI